MERLTNSILQSEIPSMSLALIDDSSTNICYSTSSKVLYDLEITGQATAGSFTLDLGLLLENDGRKINLGLRIYPRAVQAQRLLHAKEKVHVLKSRTGLAFH